MSSLSLWCDLEEVTWLLEPVSQLHPCPALPPSQDYGIRKDGFWDRDE
jgi:hypothetical protein